MAELDGETVLRVIPHIGYLHSSFEKLGEYRSWNQIIPLTDRMDYLAPLIYNVAFVAAVEKLMGVEITERCKVVRVMLMELDRIFSHLLWIGTTAIDIGAFTVFLYTFQERERIYNLHEALTGARITTSATRIGGMMADLPPGFVQGLRTFMESCARTLDEALELQLRCLPVDEAQTLALRIVQHGVTRLGRRDLDSLRRVKPDIILTTATAQGRRWRAEGLEIRVNVNVSVQQLKDHGFVAMVQKALAQHGINPGCLELELVESVLADSEVEER